MVLEHSIEEIKTAMIHHNDDDNRHFSELKESSIRKEELLNNVLTEVKKTNGRVTNLELVSNQQDKTIALLAQIVSQQHGQYEKFTTQQEILNGTSDTKYVTLSRFGLVEKIVYSGVGIILTAVLTGGLYVLFKFAPLIK